MYIAFLMDRLAARFIFTIPSGDRSPASYIKNGDEREYFKWAFARKRQKFCFRLNCGRQNTNSARAKSQGQQAVSCKISNSHYT
jgi:hypothetical protein